MDSLPKEKYIVGCIPEDIFDNNKKLISTSFFKTDDDLEEKHMFKIHDFKYIITVEKDYCGHNISTDIYSLEIYRYNNNLNNEEEYNRLPKEFIEIFGNLSFEKILQIEHIFELDYGRLRKHFDTQVSFILDCFSESGNKTCLLKNECMEIINNYYNSKKDVQDRIKEKEYIASVIDLYFEYVPIHYIDL